MGGDEEVGVQRRYAPKSICFGCGPANKKGLRIDSKRSENGLELWFTPSEEHQAFPGMVNGGIIGTLLDCHGNWVAAIALIPLAALMAQTPNPPFVVVETNRGYPTLQAAVDAIGSGEGSIAIAPGTYRQCAVQQAGRIAFLASEPGSAEFTGTACEGKAALVLRGRGATVDGLVFADLVFALTQRTVTAAWSI